MRSGSLFVVVVLLVTADLNRPAQAAPVVAGYERFGRQAKDETGRLEAGLLLLGELGCTNCHAGAAPAMVHLAPKRAPLLDTVGRRVDPEWLAAYLADPQAVHPGTTMPDLLARLPADQRGRTAVALVHFLSSTGPFDGAALPQSEKASADVGAGLYERTGCATCHGSRLTGVAALADHRPLGDLARKWSPAELDAFLKDPTKTRPTGRMPALPLSDDERRHIVAALTAAGGPGVRPQERAPFVPDPVLVADGRTAFAAIGCVNCHRLGGDPAGPVREAAGADRAKQLADLSPLAAGCLAERPPAAAAAYGLDASQRESLAVAIRWLQAPAAAAAPTRERAIERGLTASNCYACHDRDGQGGVLPAVAATDEDGDPVRVEAPRDALFTTSQAELGDEGRRPPSLSAVGSKLRPEFLREVLLAGGRDRTSTMPTRMPKWAPAIAHPLAAALAADTPVSCPLPELAGYHEREIVDQGRHLVGSKALGCIKCHSFAGDKGQSLGLIDMTRMPARLRHEWFLAYVADPQAFRPGTRMPAAWPDGRTFYAQLLDGTAPGQIEAVWRYLGSSKPRPPVGAAQKTIELVPAERPIIYRNFIEQAGPRGIAVGHPEGVHLAWDAEALRLAVVWRGAFVDAGRHWTGRGQGWQQPLGDGVFVADAATAVEILPTATAAWPPEPPRARGARFRGYTLDAGGRPAFHWSLGSMTIEEKFEACQVGAARCLRRSILLTGRPTAGTPTFRAAVGGLQDAGDGWWRVDDLWRVRVHGAGVGGAVQHDAEGRTELRFPIVWTTAGTAEFVEDLTW